MELLNMFHDYMIILLLIILLLVTYIFIYLIYSKHVSFYVTDSHALETIWTIVPLFILGFMAFPSLYLLYLSEDVIRPSLTI
jgi:heme/copper-type cytochrome/quinol oxidase subunit 2